MLYVAFMYFRAMELISIDDLTQLYSKLKTKRHVSYVAKFLICLLLILFTWPLRDADMGINLDGSYFSFFNYFFHNDIHVLQNIQYPFGPLGFLINTIAVGNNLIYNFVFWSILKVIIFFLVHRHTKSLWKTIILCGFIYYLFIYDFLFYILLSLLILSHHQTKQGYLLIVMAFFTSISMLIKVTTGFITILILGSYFIHLIFQKQFKYSLLIPVSGIFSFLAVWGLLFHSLDHVFSFLQGQYLYIFNNNDAVALYPPNNWWIMGSVFIVFFAPLIFTKRKIVVLLYTVQFLAAFALFKYAFGRQENLHSLAFFNFLCYFIILFAIYTNKLKSYSIIILLVSLPLYYLNLKHNETFNISLIPKYGGISTFYKNVIKYNSFKDENLILSKENLKPNILPKKFVDIIGKKSIDFFPWDLTYFIPNQLNYQPHTFLQSGGYPPQLVTKGAEQLVSEGPDFILWEKKKWKGEVGSIDNQYLFNADGAFVREILNWYDILEENNQVALLERQKISRLYLDSIKHSVNKFDTWIDLSSESIIQSKIKVTPTFKRKIIQALYKTPRPSIDYLLEDGTIVSFEITESAMQNGLWFNPYIEKVNTDFEGKNVSAVRFSQENWGGKYLNELEIEWMFFSKQNL